MLLPEDVHFFSGADDELLAKHLQWHTTAVTHLPTLLPFTMKRAYSPFSLQLWLLCNHASQLTYFIDGRLRVATEDAKREKAFKDVAEATTKDQKKVVEVAEKKAQALEKARALVEKGRAELEKSSGGPSLSWRRQRA